MWETILRQMWHQRKLNLWIMTGLVLITVVVWFIIDPLFVLCYNRWAVPDGFNADNLYVLSIRQYPKHSGFYHEDEADSTQALTDFHRILDILKQQPEVDSYTVVDESAYPFCDWYSYMDISRYEDDSIGTPVQFMNYFSEGDYFRTLRIRSAVDGSFLPESAPGTVYVSENMVDSFIGKGNVIGKELADVDGETYKVAGIVQNMKVSTYELPGALVYCPNGKVKEEYISENSFIRIVYRVKDDALKGISFKDYRRKMTKLLRSGNLYTEMKPFDKIRQNYEIAYGVTNKFRVQTFLMFFFLSNMLLGIIGTFWFRCRARQEEIGLRMALGCTRKRIALWFFTEGFILSTLAVVIGVFIVIQWIYFEGMYRTSGHMFFVGRGYLTDSVMLHFWCVFWITYPLILLTVAAGTFFPAWIATKVNPADTLKTE